VLRHVLPNQPNQDLGSESKDVVKLGMGLLATMAGAGDHVVPEVRRTPRWADLGDKPAGTRFDVHVYASGPRWRM